MTSESRYTWAPWIVHPVEARVDSQQLSEIGGLLPICALLWPTDERSEAETEANANLIAASPELYEALKGVISWLSVLEVMEDCPYPDVLRKRHAAARAALAKAEGREL